MRIFIKATIIILILGCTQSKLQKLSEEELLVRFESEEMPKLEEILIIGQSGDQITPDSLKILGKTEKYFLDYFVNAKNEIVKLVVRLRTAKDEAFLNKITQRLEDGPALKTVEIDCTDKVNLLQKVFDKDQEMRTGDKKIESRKDHENLEIIVSFIEKCGIPTLNEVNEIQMAGIWAVLQHAPAKYQSKYMALLEESAKKGDMQWSVIALMKDRALMHEGKPQVYGSQVNDKGLYTLFEPEYVDQRREEAGMEPLKDYLKRFNIEFDIKQKRK